MNNKFKYPIILFLIGSIIVLLGAFVKIVFNDYKTMVHILLLSGMAINGTALLLFVYNLLRLKQ